MDGETGLELRRQREKGEGGELREVLNNFSCPFVFLRGKIGLRLLRSA